MQSDHNRVEVENRLPILPKDVQAYVALKVDIWMVDLGGDGKLFSLSEKLACATYFLSALDLWGIMRIIGVDSKGEFECTTLVHAYTTW